MSRRSLVNRGNQGFSGFTLMEAMVSLIILVIVMIVTLSLMFSMRSFAERQQIRVSPRQTTRQAIDYLAFYVEGAADLNVAQNNPNALVTWRVGKAANSVSQVSYNNLTALQSAYGDPGTDIITVALPADPVPVQIPNWPGLASATTLKLTYTAGCPTNSTALQDFKNATGSFAAGGETHSQILTLVDSVGSWVYYQITSYTSADCTQVGATNEIITVSMNPATADVTLTTGHADLVAPVSMMTGVRYVSFRVKGGSLQQKQGFFDPASPDTGFSSVVEDVEDLQVAYLYRAAPDSTKPNVFIYNTSTAAIPATVGGAATNGVPPQAGLVGAVAATTWDITNVAGLRFSVSSRSKALRMTSRQLSQRKAQTINNVRPSIEDHVVPVAVDNFDHYRVTTTLMLRNRMLGS